MTYYTHKQMPGLILKAKKVVLSKYTPGPWEPICERDNDGRLIGTVKGIASPHGAHLRVFDTEYGFYGSQLDTQANARLIAAAPELLEACKMIVDTYGHLDDLTNPCVAAARTSIAKAKGE